MVPSARVALSQGGALPDCVDVLITLGELYTWQPWQVKPTPVTVLMMVWKDVPPATFTLTVFDAVAGLDPLSTVS